MDSAVRRGPWGAGGLLGGRWVWLVGARGPTTVPSGLPPDLLCPSPRDRPHCTPPVGRRWASAALLGATQLPLHSCLPAMPSPCPFADPWAACPAGPPGEAPRPGLTGLLALPPFSLQPPPLALSRASWLPPLPSPPQCRPFPRAFLHASAWVHRCFLGPAVCQALCRTRHG